jgi:hypothetical protein
MINSSLESSLREVIVTTSFAILAGFDRVRECAGRHRTASFQMPALWDFTSSVWVCETIAILTSPSRSALAPSLSHTWSWRSCAILISDSQSDCSSDAPQLFIDLSVNDGGNQLEIGEWCGISHPIGTVLIMIKIWFDCWDHDWNFHRAKELKCDDGRCVAHFFLHCVSEPKFVHLFHAISGDSGAKSTQRLAIGCRTPGHTWWPRGKVIPWASFIGSFNAHLEWIIFVTWSHAIVIPVFRMGNLQLLSKPHLHEYPLDCRQSLLTRICIRQQSASVPSDPKFLSMNPIAWLDSKHWRATPITFRPVRLSFGNHRRGNTWPTPTLQGGQI